MTVKELIEALKTCDEKSEDDRFVLQWAKYGLKK